MHVFEKHLPPAFRVSVPLCDEVRAVRLDALLWLAEACTGRRDLWALCSRLDFTRIFGGGFTGWDESLLLEMVAFCHFCVEEVPGYRELGGWVHPAMLLHWRVQGTAVGMLGARDRERYRRFLADECVGGVPLSSFPVRGRPAGPPQGEGDPPRELRSDPDLFVRCSGGAGAPLGLQPGALFAHPPIFTSSPREPPHYRGG